MNKKEKIFISTNIVSVIIIVILIIFLTKKPVIQNTCETKIQTTQQPSSKDTNIIKCSNHSDCKNNKCGMLNDNLTCCPIGFNGISNTIVNKGIEYCTGILKHGDKCVDSRQCNMGLCMKEGLNNLGICASINSILPKQQCKNNSDCKSYGSMGGDDSIMRSDDSNKSDGIMRSDDSNTSDGIMRSDNLICKDGLCAIETKNTGVQCDKDNDCKSGWCKKNNQTDEKGFCYKAYKDTNKECDINNECLSNWCKKDKETDKKGICFNPNKKINDSCNINEECESGVCQDNKCIINDIGLCVIL
jgi:hypothetical protein